MKKFVFLLSLTLTAGCDSDDDSLLLPDPAAELPAPGELPTQVTVLQLNLKDEVCPGESPLNRTGVLTHVWTVITRYEVTSDEVVVDGDLLATWTNACESEKTFLSATETYPLGPLSSDVFITVTPDYFPP